MRSASVLVVNMRGLATEVCKNIVLAGIGQLTILDDADVTEEDLGCGFFLREEDVGQKVSRRCFISATEWLIINVLTLSAIKRRTTARQRIESKSRGHSLARHANTAQRGKVVAIRPHRPYRFAQR